MSVWIRSRWTNVIGPGMTNVSTAPTTAATLRSDAEHSTLRDRHRSLRCKLRTMPDDELLPFLIPRVDGSLKSHIRWGNTNMPVCRSDLVAFTGQARTLTGAGFAKGARSTSGDPDRQSRFSSRNALLAHGKVKPRRVKQSSALGHRPRNSTAQCGPTAHRPATSSASVR